MLTIPAPLKRFDIDESGCWLWNGPIDRNGYGMVYSRGKNRIAHREVYLAATGTLPPELDHLCKRPRCVNPEHLEGVSRRENIMRSDAWSAINARKTHCPQGHPYEGDNLRIRPNGWRACRACGRETTRRHTERKRNAVAT